MEKNSPSGLVLISLSLIRFAHFMDFMIMMPLGAILMAQLQIGTTQFGILVSAYTFSAGVCGLFNSLFIDRFERRRLLTFMFVNFSLATILCGLSETYTTLLASRIYAGLSGGVITSLIYAIMSDLTSYEQRGKAMGYVMGATSLAFVAGAPYSLYLSAKFSWQAPFIVLGVFSLLLAMLNYYQLPVLKGHIKKFSRKDLFRPYKVAFGEKSTRNAILLIILLALGQYSIIPYISPYFLSNIKITTAQLSLLFVIAGIFATISSILIGRMSDRFGKQNVFYVLLFFSMIATASVTMVSSANMFLLSLITILYFVTISGRMIPALAIVTSVASAEDRGSFLTIQNTIQQFASAAATMMAASIVVEQSGGALLHFEKVGLVAIICAIPAVLIVRKYVGVK